jgi:hypothetical protein
MRWNLLNRTFMALMSSLFGAKRWCTSNTAAGMWIKPNVIYPTRHGKTGITAAKRRARKSRNRMRHQYGRA